MVTGASAGIGAAFARRLAAAGFDLILVARREERLRSLAQELERAHRIRASIHVADLTDDEQLGQTEARLRACNELVLLINCAGVCRMGPFDELDSKWVDTHLRLNAMAPARLAHAALQKFANRSHARGTGLNRGPAAIINVSSVAAAMPVPHAASYCATKSFLSTLSWCLAGECSGTDIRVQDLRAGLTRTEFPAQSGMRVAAIPEFAWAEPDEVVDASFRALRRNQVVVVPRMGDNFVPSLVRMLPLRLAREVGRFTASGERSST